ncbi:mitochondrial import inner membrane translocase subunit Tim21 isoform X2 [Arctopsyche grandis]
MLISKLLPLIRCQQRIVLQKNLINPNICIGYITKNNFSSQKSPAVSKAESGSDVSTDVRPIGEKVKEAAKTVSYTGVILFGVGVTGVIFYYVFRELFSSSSSTSIYSAALDRCIEDLDVAYALGSPIKAYGEESNRRRRNRVSHAFYERDGVKCIRMQFYIRGSKCKATVQLDMKEVDGKFEYRYLLVQLDDYTHKVIVLEDNRATVDKKSNILDNLQPLPSLM